VIFSWSENDRPLEVTSKKTTAYPRQLTVDKRHAEADMNKAAIL